MNVQYTRILYKQHLVYRHSLKMAQLIPKSYQILNDHINNGDSDSDLDEANVVSIDTYDESEEYMHGLNDPRGETPKTSMEASSSPA